MPKKKDRMPAGQEADKNTTPPGGNPPSRESRLLESSFDAGVGASGGYRRLERHAEALAVHRRGTLSERYFL